MRELTLAQQATAPDFLIQFAPILIIGVIFYLLIFMPMRKRQKKLEAVIASLKNGDKVITTSDGTSTGAVEVRPHNLFNFGQNFGVFLEP